MPTLSTVYYSHTHMHTQHVYTCMHSTGIHLHMCAINGQREIYLQLCVICMACLLKYRNPRVVLFIYKTTTPVGQKEDALCWTSCSKEWLYVVE